MNHVHIWVKRELRSKPIFVSGSGPNLRRDHEGREKKTHAVTFQCRCGEPGFAVPA